MLLEHIRYFAGIVFIAVAALLPIIDPFGGAPIYLAMTSGLSSDERARTAKLVALNSFMLLLASILIGAYVLDFFGVSIPAVQVAGGVVVCALAWSLLNGPITPDVSASPAPSPDSLVQRAFYPLTMPLTVGPGSISVAVTLGANPPRQLRALLTTTLAHVLGVLITVVAIYLCYRYAHRLVRRLGTTGTNIMIRLTAFILLAIGTQIIWNGARTMLTEVLHPSAPAPPAAVALPRPAASANGKLGRLERARLGAQTFCGNPTRRCGEQLALEGASGRRAGSSSLADEVR